MNNLSFLYNVASPTSLINGLIGPVPGRQKAVRRLQSSKNTLRADRLYYERNDRIVLRNLSFSAFPGTLLQIFGANGSGKSTLLRLLAGLLRPTTGQVHLPEANLSGMVPLLYVGHTNGLRGMLTAHENLALNQRLNGLKPNPAAIDSTLEAIGVTPRNKSVCSQLSAGQQRRVAIGRLRLIPANIWLLDEPMTALDTGANNSLPNCLKITSVTAGS